MDLGRNDPCWCGSGKKYKRCHLGRERSDRPPVSESIGAVRSAQRRRMCLHPDASPETCQGGIVQAHSVQEKMLRCIARNGHVYGFSTDFAAMVNSGGVIEPRLLGINRASTFTGFCAKHDDQVFASIEKNPVSACEEHACILAYRALTRELFAKEGVVGLQSHLQSMDRGLPLYAQEVMQAQIASMAAGSSTALAEIQNRKRQYDEMIANCTYSSTRYFVVWFDLPPDILCAGCKYPMWDFAGHQLQDLTDLAMPAQDIALSLIAVDDRGCAFFSWPAAADRVGGRFIKTLAALSDDELPQAVVRFVFGSFENQFWAPDWWDSLDETTRQALLERFRLAVHPSKPIPSHFFQNDGVVSVRWQVTSRASNFPDIEC